MNTHSAIIQLSEGVKAFVDGIPDKCDHDDKGDTILWTKSGKTIHWHTFRQWASLPTNPRIKLILEHQDEIDDPVIGSCVSCSKCKKPFSPPMF
jgi:hypothetical protein